MKFLLLLLFPVFGLAQKKDFDVVVESPNIYGYVNSIRLDSINAKYAQAEIIPSNQVLSGDLVKRYTFDYGQKWDKIKEVRITSNDDRVLTFNSLAATLNFFSYNGWELVDVYQAGTGKQIILLKKNRK